MSVVRRRREAIDAFERAMLGVKTYDPQQTETRNWDSCLIGTSSAGPGEAAGDPPVEHEVTIVIQRRPRRERTR